LLLTPIIISPISLVILLILIFILSEAKNLKTLPLRFTQGQGDKQKI